MSNPIKKGGLALGLSCALGLALAAPAHAELRTFELTVEEVEIEVAPGFTYKVWGYNGQVPGPLLRVDEGDEVEVTMINNSTLSHTIHWHGIFQTGTWQGDGVPNVTQKAIEPGESYTYRFVADKSGSLWYHCHVNVPEHVGIRGMWGPLIVNPKNPIPIEQEVTKDAILMFGGWNSDVAMEFGKGGHPRDKNDYFSINGKAFPLTQPLRVTEGDVLRLRLFAASMPVAFHLHGHDMLVTHKDGLPLDSPYWADVVDLAMGSRIDVIVRMDNPGLWAVHDHIEHHTSNAGRTDGGAMLVVEYEEIEQPEWYAWKDKEYDPDFYLIETMAGAGPGLHENPAYVGTAPAQDRRPRRQ